MALGLELGSPSRVDQNQINEKLKCCPRYLKTRFPCLNFVLIHKSYVHLMFKNNAAYIDRNRDLGIHTRCISLVPYNLRKI